MCSLPAPTGQIWRMEHGDLAIRLAGYSRSRPTLIGRLRRKGVGFSDMQIENVMRLAGRLARLTLVMCPLALAASPVCAQRYDDSYKGPSQSGGLDGQMRGLETPPAAPLPGAGATLGGGLQGRQTQGTIAP